MNHGDPFARTAGWSNRACIALSRVLRQRSCSSLDAARANPVFRWSRIAGVIGSASALFGLGLFRAPTRSFTGQAIEGGTVVNTLLLGYLLPTLSRLTR